MKKALPFGVSVSLYLRHLPKVLCHLRLITNLKSARYTLSRSLTTTFLVLFTISLATAQKIEKLEQAANGPYSSVNNPVTWVTGNVNEAKAHYAECMTIPYHLEIINLVAGQTYCVSIGYDTKKNGKNAIDFLTTYNADIAGSHPLYFYQHVQNVTEVIDPTDNTGLENIASTNYNTVTTSIPTPSFPGASGYTVNPLTYFQGLMSADKQFTLYNGKFIGTPCYDSEQSLGPTMPTSSASVRVCFQLDKKPGFTLPNTVVLAWGGHIAAEAIWGSGTSATAITGSPYHTFVAACGNNDPGFDVSNPGVNCNGSNPNSTQATGTLDGCGNKEVQLSASAVAGGGNCDILGEMPICTSSSTGYDFTAIFYNLVANGSMNAPQYDWEITPLTGDASFASGSIVHTLNNKTATEKVYVVASGTFKLTVTVKKGSYTATCEKTVIIGSTPTIGSSNSGNIPSVNATCPPYTQTVAITATVGNTVSPVYQWQRSKDGGSTWVDINSFNAATLDNYYPYFLTYDAMTLNSNTLNITINGFGAATGFKYRLTVTNNNGDGCSTTSTSGGLLTISGCPLPIELNGFDGKQVENTVALKWTTESEKNNAYFEVQRSKDGIHFYPIGWRKGYGTTTEPKYYDFVDAYPFAGINYYRLKQVDLDSTFEYHKIIAVPFNGKVKHNDIHIYPTEVKDQLVVAFDSAINQSATLQIVDITGRIVLHSTVSAGSIQEQFPVSNLPTGHYFVTLQTDQTLSTARFVKVR